ncbi:hypothetical protein BA190_10270 [Labrys sp. WJW]|uniref:hypothetical protein n=1 Tax=Labrys sp. WJW TaxID=1737983 RepID=UPI00082A0CA8|nr:hypothetical protein [Labrys sp. WJW]OCC05279.1 hypothetical protein BA190_10270 [Labrys sp. WJW]
MIDRKRLYDAVRPLFGGHFTQAQVNGVEAILERWETAEGSDLNRPRMASALAAAFTATGSAMQPADGDLVAFALRYGPNGDGCMGPAPRLRGRRSTAPSDDVTAFLAAADEIAACFLLGLRVTA